MADKKDLARFRANWQGEVDSTFLYRTLSRSEKNAQIAKVYAKLADVEEKHAHFWELKLKEAGASIPEKKASLRSKALCFLARRFGPRFVLPAIATQEQVDRNSYDNQPEAKHTELPGDEHSHARVLKAITQTSKGGVEGGMLAQLEGRHRSVGGNALRAAVLGANDGLVSNLSLIMGVAGAALSSRSILVTGVAGLLAGACSMAMGEWLSVQSSRELYTRQIEVEAQELVETPREEEAELALIYQAKGFSKAEAERMAEHLIKDEQNALSTLAREELGIDPDTLGGSAWEAALTSFVLFTAGAAVPLAPFVFFSGTHAVLASLLFSAAGLFVVGGLITLLTGRGVIFSGVRQLAIGLGAAGITFGLGHLIGGTIH